MIFFCLFCQNNQSREKKKKSKILTKKPNSNALINNLYIIIISILTFNPIIKLLIETPFWSRLFNQTRLV